MHAEQTAYSYHAISLTADMSATHKATVVILSGKCTIREVQIKGKSNAAKNPTLLLSKML